jgi:hypothetical protein
MRGGGSGRNRHRAFSIAGDATHAPSPLHQVQRLSSPPHQEPSGDPTKSSLSANDAPRLYLQGVIRRGSHGIDYTFREISAPHTEPRRHIGRLVSLTRSLSSGAVPSSRRASQSRASSGSDDVFGTLPAVGPPARSRQLSSEASGVSAQYSYYGSLASETRYPSSEHSSQDHFSYFQFDGAAASYESSRGDGFRLGPTVSLRDPSRVVLHAGLLYKQHPF